jgi:hypothetical protein
MYSPGIHSLWVPKWSHSRGSSEEDIGPDQSTASLHETLDWLRVRVPRFSTFTFDEEAPGNYLAPDGRVVHSTHSQTFSWLEIDSCHLRYAATATTRYDPGLELERFNRVDTFTFELWLNKVGRVFVEEQPKAADTKPMSVNGKPIWHVFSSTYGDQISRGANFYCLVRDKETALRIGRALKHAAILCGAKLDQ